MPAGSDCFPKQRAAVAWEQGRFDGQCVPVEAPDVAEDGSIADTAHVVHRDEGLRETSLE